MSIEAMVDAIAASVAEATGRNAGPGGMEAVATPGPHKSDPIAYYESGTGHYFIKNQRGEWIKFTESSLKRLMLRTIYASMSRDEGRDTAIDNHFVALQTKLDVTTAMPLAGYETGLHILDGERILVTRSARPVKGRAGEWDTFRFFCQSLMPGQTDYFYGWIKAGLKSRKDGPPFRPGQLLALPGPSGCGKSLLQGIITEIFGGRSAKPYKYMTGQTQFNSELFFAEHLMIEDEAASTNLADRLRFGANIKNMLVNQTQPFYRKGREALSASPFWRISLSVNDEPESLIVMPPINADLVDKIIMIKCSPANFPFDPDDIVARRKWREAITNELPAFIAWVTTWRLPDKLRDQRYGVKAYQHPELLEQLSSLAPQSELLDLIDALKPWGADDKAFIGNAVELRERLMERDKHNRVGTLLRTATWTGVYLARLKKSHPARVDIEKREGNKAVWIITPPSATSANGNQPRGV